MLVKDYMLRHPPMAEPTMSIIEAQAYMGQQRIRHLPIVGDGKRLLGLVTRQSLLVDPGRLQSVDMWEITRYLSGLTVADVMIRREAVVTIHPDSTIEDAAQTMVEHHVGCLPVLDEEVVIGLLTERDLLEHITQLLVTSRAAVRATIRMPNRRGELAKLVSTISSHGWGILACGGVPAPKNPDIWEAVIKIQNVPLEEIEAALRTIPDQELVDIRECKAPTPAPAG